MSLESASTNDARAATLWLRAISLAVAGVVSVALTVDPYILRGVSGARVHAGLPLLMLGVASALAYGLGFEPGGRVSRVLLHPAFAWALLGTGTTIFAFG